MKKLSQSLRNKRFTLANALTIITIYYIFSLVVFFEGMYRGYNFDNVFDYFQDYAPDNINMFTLGAGGIIYDPFLGLPMADEVYFLFLTFFVSFSSFKFLHKKSLGLTTLGFPKTRATLFNTKTILPLTVIIASAIIAKTIALVANIQYYGFSNNLLGIYVANTLILIQYILLGYTIGIFSRVFTGRTFEGLIAGASVVFLPKAIYFLTSTLSEVFLHGYADVYKHYLDNVMFLDPTKHFISGFESYTRVLTDTATPVGSIVYSVFWIAISIISLVFLKKYFCKNTRFEYIGFTDKRKAVTFFNSVSLPLAGIAIATYYYFQFNHTTTEKTMYFLIATLLGIIASLILNALLTKSIRFNKSKLIPVTTILGTILVITVISLTGGLGYESRIPEKDKIEKIILQPSFYITEVATASDNTNGDFLYSVQRRTHGTDFFTPDNDYPPISANLQFSNKEDFEAIFRIHQSAIDNKKNKETCEIITITYVMENGNSIVREYYYLSEETVKSCFELWETETIKNTYKNWLLNSEEDIKNKENIMDFNFKYNAICLLDGVSVYVSSKNGKETPLDNLTEEEFIVLKSAIYNDIASLTWEQWFKPEKTYGGITFINNFNLNSYLNYSSHNEIEYSPETSNNYYLYFPVTSEMKHTLKALDTLGATDILQTTPDIQNAYLVDTEDIAEWYAEHAESIDIPESELQLYHSIQFDNSNKQFMEVGNYFDHPYYGDDIAKITTVLTRDEAKELLEKGHQKYYCGSESDLLFIEYTNLITGVYLIPNQ